MKNSRIKVILIVSILATILYTGSGFFEYYDINQKLDSTIKKGFLSNDQFTEYKTPQYATYVRFVGNVTGFPITVLFSPFAPMGEGALGIAILLGIFDVPIVFLSWFFVLFGVTSLFSKFSRGRNISIDAQPIQKFNILGNGIFIISCIIIVVILIVWKMMYTQGVVGVTPLTTSRSADKPLTLSSIIPDNGKDGDIITLNGMEFANKTITIWLVDKQKNKYGFLWKGIPASDSPISFPLKLSLCSIAFNPCGGPLNVFSKGEYVIEVRGGGPDVSLPFRVNENIIVSNRLPIDLSKIKHGTGGNGGKVTGSTLYVDTSVGSTAWITAEISTTKPLNYLEFDASMASLNGSMLSVYIDQKELGGIKVYRQKTQEFALKIDELPAGTHTLSFRLDSYNTAGHLVENSVTISNLLVGTIN